VSATMELVVSLYCMRFYYTHSFNLLSLYIGVYFVQISVV